MYKLLLSIPTILLLSSCNNNKVIRYSDGSIKEKISYKNGLRNGEALGFYNNGDIEWKGLYLNDTLNGQSYIYFKNGKIKSESYFYKGKEDGIEKNYYENGKLYSTIEYKNGLKHGNATFYYLNGIIMKRAKIYNDTTQYYEDYDSAGVTKNIQHSIFFTLLNEKLNSKDSIRIKAIIKNLNKDVDILTLLFDPKILEKKTSGHMRRLNDSTFVHVFPPQPPSTYAIMINFLVNEDYRNDFTTDINIVE